MVRRSAHRARRRAAPGRAGLFSRLGCQDWMFATHGGNSSVRTFYGSVCDLQATEVTVAPMTAPRRRWLRFSLSTLGAALIMSGVAAIGVLVSLPDLYGYPKELPKVMLVASCVAYGVL